MSKKQSQITPRLLPLLMFLMCLGVVNPVKQIAEIAHRHGAKILWMVHKAHPI